MPIRSLSAVTLAVSDMTRSVRFYRNLGFELACGGEDATFTSLGAGPGFLNLIATDGHRGAFWGRAIFHVDDVDEHHRLVRSRGIPADPPADASWGERYFHVTDPDGHQLSFAQPLARAPHRAD